MRTINNNTNSNKSNAYKLHEGLPMLKPEDFQRFIEREGKGKLVTIYLEWPGENGEVNGTTEVFAVKGAKKEQYIEAQNECYLSPEERYAQYKELGWTDGAEPVSYVSQSLDPEDECGFAKAFGAEKEIFVKLGRFQFRTKYFKQYGVWPKADFAEIKDKPKAKTSITPTKAIAATTITLKPKAAKASSRR